jgi:porin
MNRTILCAGILGVIAAGAAPPVQAEDDLWHRETLTGDWQGARTALHDWGIDPSLSYIGETLGDVDGGTKRNFVYQGRADLSLDADLEKLVGWTGAVFHGTLYQIHRTSDGIGLSLTGSLGDPSNIEALPATRLFTLYLEQHAFGDKLSVRVGQLAADDEFLISDTAGNLINGTFGWADLGAANLPSGGAAYPLATPGVRVQVKPTDQLTLLGAVFSGDPAGHGCDTDPQICDRNGAKFSFTGGAFWIGEAQYAINQGDGAAGLPGVYKLGGWYQNARFADQRYGVDAAGHRVALASASAVGPDNHTGNFAIYGVADQMVWRSQDKSQSLSAFLRVGGAPGNRNLVSLYVDGGLGFAGLFPGREKDVLTLGVAYAKISGDASDLDRDTRAAGDPAFPIRDQETVIELNYLAQITPWFTVQPDIQYIVHPGGNVQNPNDVTGGTIPNALVIGVRASLTF